MIEPISPKVVIVGALASVLAELTTLVKALSIPGIIYLALNFYTVEEISPGIAVALALASLLLHTLFAITTHRVVMLGADSVPEWGLRSWTMRETRFAGYVLGLIMAFSLLVAFALAIPPIGPIIVMVVGVVGGCTLSLVFPAVAVEENFNLGDAWRMAQGHIGSLIVCVGLFPFLLALPIFFLAAVPYAQPLAAILQLITTVLTIAVLSVAFGEIRRAQKT